MKKLLLFLYIFTAGATVVFAAAGPEDGISGSMSSFTQESFQTDLATGAATMSLPVSVPPGRKNMQPGVALSYSSNNQNGVAGVGWALPLNCIQRSTKSGVPNYNSTDTYIFASGGSNAELVNIGGAEYRAKLESAFMKYIFDDSANSWIVFDKSGTRYFFGTSGASRIEDSGNVFAWYLDRVEDVYGNYITYTYEKPADGQIYIKEIDYTGSPGMAPDKKVVFNYLEARADKLFSYRSGWEIVTSRRLSSVYVYLGSDIVYRYELDFTLSPDTERSLLHSVTVFDKNGNSLPPKTFTYSRLEG